VDVNWDNMFSSKISNLLSVSLNVRMFYDKDISSKRQLKQVLALGLSYALLRRPAE
jgi:cytochrome c oxidase assembly protein Cox11